MTERTSNKIWAGIAAGLLTTAVLAFVGIGAYRAGQRSEQTIEVVGRVGGEGDVARTVVVEDGWRGGWHGPGPAIWIVPLIIVGVCLLFASRRGPRYGWNGGGWQGDPESWRRGYEHERDDWHRRAHASDPGGSPGSGSAPPPPPTSPPDPLTSRPD